MSILGGAVKNTAQKTLCGFVFVIQPKPFRLLENSITVNVLCYHGLKWRQPIRYI
jgi:hypothetical protein